MNSLFTCAVILLLGLLNGCGAGERCPGEVSDPVTVVLTFDDGPLSADLPSPELTPDERILLGPLRTILDTLDRRNARAVFFVEGPGHDEAGDALVDVFAEGIVSIHERGHVLGYHAFNHDPRIWSLTLGPPIVGRIQMHADLDRLENYLDRVLATVGGARIDLFAPLFRQPFGGSGVSRVQGRMVAARRGWTYHGFVIDSVDWTDNADADPGIVLRLPIGMGEERIDFVRERLRFGVLRNLDRKVIDVLLHINTFTALNLDAWIDELEDTYARERGVGVIFDVPACYLTSSDTKVDRTLTEVLLGEVWTDIWGP